MRIDFTQRARSIGWTEDALKAVTSRFAAVALPSGSCLLDQGPCAPCAWLILSGAVKLVASSPSDRRAIIGIRQAGALVGGASAVTATPQPFAAHCLCPTDAVQMASVSLRELMQEQPEVASVVHRLLHLELAEALEDWAVMSTLDVTGRISHVLGRLTCEQASGRRKIALRQFELAQAAMTSVPNLHRVMRKMEASGSVARRRGWVMLGATAHDGFGAGIDGPKGARK